MAESEPDYFVTNDKWMRLPGGQLDKTDKQILKGAGKNVKVITMAEALDRMQKEAPAKFEEFHKQINRAHGIVMTLPQLYEFASKANETKSQFDQIANFLTVPVAQAIRKWRVDDHLTWRGIARRMGGDSNQLLGMAFCERAALMCNEDYLKAPWN